MKVIFKNQRTGEEIEYGLGDILIMDIEPETKAEEDFGYWGQRRSVKGYIEQLKKELNENVAQSTNQR